ncbi:MAG: hypothetical protein MZV70_72915 [Desulfobacterales bacterium]|nr:hypothetical protein [Desulfobacterales bacterium]
MLARSDGPGALLAVHAEDWETTAREMQARPGSLECERSGRIFAFPSPQRRAHCNRASPPGTEAHEIEGTVCHVSTPEALDRIRKQKAGGLEVYAETCPHYLLLSQETARPHGPFARVKPPIRSEALREELFRRFRDGSIDILSSDHAPYLPTEKEKGLEDIWRC